MHFQSDMQMRFLYFDHCLNSDVYLTGLRAACQRQAMILCAVCSAGNKNSGTNSVIQCAYFV